MHAYETGWRPSNIRPIRLTTATIAARFDSDMAQTTHNMADSETLAKRLVRLAAKLDAATWQAGADWYPAERAALLDIAERHGFGFVAPDRLCAAYAALSPQQPPQRNRELFTELLTTDDASTYKAAVGKAMAAMIGHAPAGPDGRKVRSFAANLAGCEHHVTVDRWAVRACGVTGRMAEGSVPARHYGTFEHAYRLAAGRLNTTPRTLQAALWVHTRGSSGQ